MHCSGALRAIQTQPATATASRLLDDMTTNTEATDAKPDRLDRLTEYFVIAAKHNLPASAAPLIDELRSYGATYPALRKLLADRLDWTPLLFESFMQDVEESHAMREQLLDAMANDWGADK